MLKTSEQIILKQLLAVRERIPTLQKGEDASNYGICVHIYADDSYQIMSRLFRKWEHFSGSYHFPVPISKEMSLKSQNGYLDSTKVKAAEKAYTFARNKWIGEYGTLRIDLLEHCIKELESETL